MLIEFMGLPGSGKTTFANDLGDHAQTLFGSNLLNLTQLSRSKFSWRLRAYALRKLFLMIPAAVVIRKECIRLLDKPLNLPARYGGEQLADYVNDLSLRIWLHDRLDNSEGCYCLDEGVSQSLVILRVNFDISETILESLYTKVCNSAFRPFWYRVNPAIAEASMIGRDRHVCYIDELRGSELTEYLSRFNDACELVARITNAFPIERTWTELHKIEEVGRLLNEF
jgi:hypothetical protein